MNGDLDPMFGMVSGTKSLGQALVGRLTTPRGGLFYDSDYGTDLRAYLNAPMTQQALAKLSGDVQAECLKDERVQSAACSPTWSAASGVLTLHVNVITGSGPFKLVIGVTSMTVALMQFTPS